MCKIQKVIVDFPLKQIQSFEAILNNRLHYHLKKPRDTFLECFVFCFYFIQNALDSLITEISDDLHVCLTRIYCYEPLKFLDYIVWGAYLTRNTSFPMISSNNETGRPQFLVFKYTFLNLHLV